MNYGKQRLIEIVETITERAKRAFLPYFEAVIEFIRKIGLSIVERAKKIYLPFFDGVPLYDVALFFWRSIMKGSITTRASAIAFSFFLALFPFLIFLLTLIPFISKVIDNFQEELFNLISDVVPVSTFETIETTVEDILNKPSGELLSLGFFMALIFSTNGLVSMMNAFDATVHTIHKRSWISQYVAAALLLIILTVLLSLAIFLLTVGQTAINYINEKNWLQDQFVFYLLSIGQYVVIIILFFFAYSFLYYVAPSRKTKWRFISAGGTLATLLSIITFVSFSYYINNFSQYNILYGSIGTLLIILLLIYIMSLILLLGFELNASIHQAQKRKKLRNINVGVKNK